MLVGGIKNRCPCVGDLSFKLKRNQGGLKWVQFKSRHRSDCALTIYGCIIGYYLILWYIIVYHLVLYYILWFVGPNSNFGFDLEPGSFFLGSMCLF